MHYPTRHLEALRETTHGDLLVPAGGRFWVTSIDAEYYLQHGRAKEVAAIVAPPPTTVAPTPSPTAAPAPALAPEPISEAAAEAPTAAAASTEEPPPLPAAPRSRRTAAAVAPSTEA